MVMVAMVMVKIMYCTLRKRELSGLSVLNLDANFATITRTYAQLNGCPAYVLERYVENIL